MNLQTISVFEHEPRPGAKKGYGTVVVAAVGAVAAAC